MPSLDDTADLHTEFCITLSLNILVATINNNGHPAIAKPLSGTYPIQPPDDADDADDADLSRVLNAVATILVRKSENIATIACKPLPPANSVLSSGPNPYQIYALENIEPMTCLGSEASPNDADCVTSQPSDDNNDGDIQKLKDLSAVAVVANPDRVDQYFKNVAGPEQCIIVNSAKSHMSKILDASNLWEQCLQIS
jgi:hypothetical protein